MYINCYVYILKPILVLDKLDPNQGQILLLVCSGFLLQWKGRVHGEMEKKSYFFYDDEGDTLTGHGLTSQTSLSTLKVWK